MTNKGRIIQTSIELFRLFGYDGTSIDMLIKRAGISKSNFYYHFESKEKLGLKVIEILFNHQKDLLLILTDRDINPCERFVRFYIEAIYAKRDLLLQSGCFFANFEQDSANERFRSPIEMFFQKTEASVEVCLREFKELGLFNKGINLELLPQFIISQFKGAMVMAQVHRSYTPLENAYEGLTDLLIKKKWQHLIPRHSQLPLPMLSYDDQLKPYIFS